MNPTILFLAPSDIDTIRQKSVFYVILQRDEGGYFQKVISAHPYTRRSQTLQINDTHTLIDIGPDWLPPGVRDIRWVRKLLGPVHLAYAAARLVRLARQERVTLIRAQDPFWNGLLAWWVSRRIGVPFCVSLHADYELGFSLDPGHGGLAGLFGSSRLALGLQRFVLSRAPLVLPIRQHLADVAVKNGARPDAVRIIPHGIDLDPFRRPPTSDPYELFAVPRDKKILSFVGRVAKDNFVADVVELARRLGRDRADVAVVMAGGGPEEEWLRRTVASDETLRRVVHVVGYQPRETGIDLRRASAVSLCLMGGMSLIESCAAGRPVVSYDVDWHSELVQDGRTGFLPKLHDIDRLESSVRRLLDHPDEARRMGEAARLLAFERHDVVRTSGIKRKWYDELLSRKA